MVALLNPVVDKGQIGPFMPHVNIARAGSVRLPG